jgi:phosphatidyl-myo-inositol dimannoside synthase
MLPFSRAEPALASRVLFLTPSRGLGGGIERYAETLEWAFAARGVDSTRIDLHGAHRLSRSSAHAQMLATTRNQLRASAAPARLVVMHLALLPTASLLARRDPVCGVSIVCHGNEVWGHRSRIRRGVENYLMRRPGVRIVATSNFTAGALSSMRPTILLPGLSGEWFSTLAGAAACPGERGRPTSLVTAFSLAQWREKGLPQLLDAVAALSRPDIRVTVCGIGNPSEALLRLVREHRFCVLRVGLTAADLARQFAAADLFVLATQPRSGRDAFYESFGLALLEAQVAGTAVVGPAHGGSRDAFIDQLTGVAPADETPAALTQVLDELLRDPPRLAEMGRRAAIWARESFSPERYAARAVAALL